MISQRMRGLIGTLTVTTGLLCVGGGLMATPASAQHYDRYYGQRYYRGRDSGDIRRREILRNRLIDLGDRVRLAERERQITRNQARDLYEDLDDVRDFLRRDSNLTDSEFNRRRDDLEDVARRLNQWGGRRYGRYDDRRGRYDSRYDDRYRYDDRDRYGYRYDDRYRRR